MTVIDEILPGSVVVHLRCGEIFSCCFNTDLLLRVLFAFSALTLLVGWQEGHWPVKN